MSVRKLQRGDRVVALASITEHTRESVLGEMGTVQKANTGACDVLFDNGILLKTTPRHFVVVERGTVTAAEASEEKGYPHPGSAIVLPNHGGTIHLQFGHRPEVGVNGCFTTDVLTGLILNLETYQQVTKGYERVALHPMATLETDQALLKLREARMWIEERRADRKARDVYETDKP